MATVACLVIFAAIVVEYTSGLQVIPERANIVLLNSKYAIDGKFYVKRYSRKSAYYFNIEGTTKQTWNNNVSMHLIFYEYLHNEYKRSFVEMNFNFCEMLRIDPYIGKALAATGIACPIPPGRHRLLNLTVPADNFPNVWPFEKSKVDVKLRQLPTEELICNLELYLLFKQNKKN